MELKNQITVLKILMITGLISLIAGFCICTTSSAFVSVGIIFYQISIGFLMLSLIQSLRIQALKEKEREDRIKKMEDMLIEIKSKIDKV